MCDCITHLNFFRGFEYDPTVDCAAMVSLSTTEIEKRGGSVCMGWDSKKRKFRLAAGHKDIDTLSGDSVKV